MFIPVSPSTISGAQAYNVPAAYVKLPNFSREYDRPAPEGNRALPMQFSFDTYTAWKVTINNYPEPPMRQLAALFIDTSQSDFDVNIYFPDTGYTRRIEQGGGVIIPVISGLTPNQLPSFYVLLDSDGLTSNSLVNIQALNFYPGQSISGEVQKTLSYGYSTMFTLEPQFTQATTFCDQVLLNGVPFATNGPVIDNSQWFITAINISIVGKGSGGDVIGNVRLSDVGGGTTIGQYAVSLPDGVLTNQTLTDQSGLNIISKGGGPLTFDAISVLGASNVVCQLYINIAGGILVD